MSTYVSIPCNHCKTDTRHRTVAEHHKDYPEAEEDGVISRWETVRGRLLACLGCDTPTYETSWTLSGMCDNNGDPIWEVEAFYPVRFTSELKGKYYNNLPTPLERIYVEAIGAFNKGLSLLLAVALRMLVEGICKDCGVNGRRMNLEGRLMELGRVKNLPDAIVNALDALRLVANDAAHDLSQLNSDDLLLVLEVAESLMQHLYHDAFQETEVKARHFHRKYWRPKTNQ